MLANYDFKNGFSLGFGKGNNTSLNQDTIGFLNNNLLDNKFESLDKIASKYKNADQNAIEFAESIRSGSIQLKKGQTYLQAYQEQLENTGFSFKNLGASVLSGLKSLGANAINFAASAGTLFLLSKGIELGAKFVDSLITTEEEAEEARQNIRDLGQEARNSADEINSNFKKTESTVKSVAGRYAELAQGVKNLGKASQSQGTLSTSEYEEFLEISNQLAELFPRLTSGYDDNGNAILNLHGNVQTITSSLYDLVDAEKEASSLEIQEKMGDIWKEFALSINESIDSITIYEEKLQTLQAELENFKNPDIFNLFNTPNSSIRDMQDQIDLIGDLLKKSGLDANDIRGKTYEEFSKQEKIAIEDAFAEINAEYTSQARILQADIDNENKRIASYAQSSLDYLYDGSDYEQLISGLINNYDYVNAARINLSNINTDGGINEFLDSLADAVSWDSVFDNIKEDIIDKFTSLEGDAKEEFDEVYNNLLSINPDASLAENTAQIDKYITDLSRILELDKNQIEITLGYDLASDRERLQSARDRLGYVIPNNSGDAKRNKEINDFIYSLSDKDIQLLLDAEIPNEVKTGVEEDWINFLEELRKRAEMMDFSFDIGTESTGLNNLSSAINESVSATGLASESIENLENRYKDLENYDAAKLFEKTENGIHLNTEALNELEQAYENQKKTDIDNHLNDLTDEYARLTEELNKCDDAARTAQLYSERENILAQIEDTSMLAAQYDGLTSSYNKWIQAKSTEANNAQYAAVGSSYESMKEILDSGWYGNDDLNAYLDLMLSAEQRTGDVAADFAKLTEKIDGTNHSLMDYWQFDDNNNLVSDGLFNFLDDVNKKFGDTYAKIDEETGKYSFDFSGDKLQEVADEFGMSTEMVELFVKALKEAGMTVDFGDPLESFNLVKTSIEEANDTLKEMGATDYTFNLGTDNIDYLNEQIVEAEKLLNQVAEKDGIIDLNAKGAEEAASILGSLIYQKNTLEAPVIFSVDTSNATDDVTLAVAQLQEFKDLNSKLELETKLGVDTTQTQAEIDNALAELANNEIVAQLGIDTSSIDAAIVGINEATPKVLIDAGLNSELIAGYTSKGKNLRAKYEVDSEEVDNYNPKNLTRFVFFKCNPNAVDTYINSLKAKSVTIPVSYSYSTNSKIPNGAVGLVKRMLPTYANGTQVAIRRNEKALVNELGNEGIVRQGKLIEITGGAQLVNLRRGDIIFNHKQMEELKKRGRVTSNGGRGQLIGAYLYGTLNSINAYSGDGVTGGNGTPRTVTESSSDVVNNSSKSKTTSSSSSADEVLETTNWIETSITRIEEAIDRLDKVVTNTYTNWTSRNSALSSQIEKTKEEISLQQKAYEAYMKKANSVGLSEAYKQKVQNGAIQIEDISDETLKQQISDYKEWYEKAIECKDAVDELKISLGKLAETKFDNLQDEFEGFISIITAYADIIDERINRTEEHGYFVSKDYYKQLIDYENQELAELQKEYEELTKAKDNALSSGTIEKDSEAWNDMTQEILDVQKAIEESTTALVEFNNAMRDLDWEIFDYVEERIGQITSESEFLIDLLEKEKLYDDTGAFSAAGMADMALHGVNYNTYMQQALDYTSELKKVQSDLAKDKANKDLIERREELLELQQKAIRNAQAEKDAVKSLVEDGIKLHLEVLDNLISKYKDSLDAAKDLYEYQKKISEQTDEIANLEKILMAYQGDDSEETRKRIQETQNQLEKAKTDLQETEWDKYISETKELLSRLRDDYSEVLNARLDNMDALISDMIDTANENTDLIRDAITSTADKVGYTITDSMKSVLGDGSKLVTMLSDFSGKFETTATTLQATINAIKSYVYSMTDEGKRKVEEESKKNTPTVPATSTAPTTSTTNSSTQNTASNKSGAGDGKANVGDAVTFASGKYHEDSWGNGRSGNQMLGGTVYITKIAPNSPYPYHISRTAKFGEHNLGWVKLEQLKGYSIGSRQINHSQLAWTQENGSEMLYRASDGAMLTRLDTGDKVYTKEMSDRLWEVAKGNIPRNTEYRHPNLNLSGNDRTVNNENSISITLPNVTNYDEFKAGLQNDNRFIGFMQEVTLGQALGHNTLSKNKY